MAGFVSGPSCKTCPSFMNQADVTSAVGRSINSPICKAKLIPLYRPGSPPDEHDIVMAKLASKCDLFGKPAPHLDGAALRTKPLLTLRVGVSTKSIPEDADMPTVRDTCYGCANLIGVKDVGQATGWSAPICGAKGTLLFADRLNKYPGSCGAFRRKDRLPLSEMVTLSDFMFFPEYQEGFGKVDIKKMLAEQDATLIPPHEWPTDKPVSAGAKANGVGAWRKVKDPEGYGPDIFLPVMDQVWLKESYPEVYDNVPRTGDEEHPEWYLDHAGLTYRVSAMWRELDETPALWGPAGVGKTELLRHLAWLMATPFTRISITATSETDDLIGTKEFNPERGTYFRWGRIPLAWARPGVLLLDEPNVGPDAVWHKIRPLTDDSKQMVLDEGDGNKVDRHPHLYFGLAMNPAWDMRNVGANTIGDADGSRLMHIFMDYPPEEIERQIIARRCAADDYDISPHLDRLIQIGNQLRDMALGGQLHTSWGLRPQIKVARAFRIFRPLTAYRAAVTDFLEPRQAALVLEVVKSYYGS